MSLTLALNTALTGLNVNQRSLTVLSQNIANANNPEYSRKLINQEAIYLQGTGSGVRIRDVGRRVDDYLQRSVRLQGAVFGRTEVLSNYTERLQVLLGRPGSQNSVYSYINGFFNAMQNLSQSPENVSLRVNAVNMAGVATREMQTLASGIYDMQYQVDQDISSIIQTANNNLKEIYTLNSTIVSNKLLGRSVSELEDRRDSLLASLSTNFGVQTYAQSNGAINVFSGNGQSLLDENLYELAYNPAPSSDFFLNGNSSDAIRVYRLDEDGNRLPNPNQIVSSGVGAGVTTLLTQGSIKGLLEIRDRQLPEVLEKLNMLASRMRDEFNAVHNKGSAFPGANSYTGTRLLSPEDYSEWSGTVRIAVLDSFGRPIASPYSDEVSGVRPLLMDLSTLDTGNGAGIPSVQGIIDEINRAYGVPQNKVTLGNVNDIRLVLNNTDIPGDTPELNFDFQLENISSEAADFFVTDLQVLDSNDVDITSITQDVPKVNLASTGTYVTTASSSTISITTASAHGYQEGDRVYLSPPSSDVDGISSTVLGGFFTISNVTSTGFDITAPTAATAGGSHNRSGVTSQVAYDTIGAGENKRTKESGTITAGISANTTSSYYTVKASVAVVDEAGNISHSTITYRIDNLQFNTKNYRYAATAATGAGNVISPNTARPSVRAVLVDENGTELPIANNQYSTSQRGYLKIIAGDSSHSVVIDSLDSYENGRPNAIPRTAATVRGFSHYFELNNFFANNRSDAVVDDVERSASRMAVSDHLRTNPNLIALGQMGRSPNPTDPNADPLYTYERNIGDNSIIDILSKFSTTTINFAAAGDLGATSQNFLSYSGQIISTASAKAANNKSDMDNAKLLLDGFSERSDAVRGVNLDEELANTIIYQNAYSASARIITVANQFFEALLDSVR